MSLTSPIKLNIAQKIEKDKDYRKKFFQRRTQDEIAMSIRGLRENRKMRQVDLAKKSDMKQSAISRIEQADYSAWSLTTLFRVADALEARLRVVFEPVENGVNPCHSGMIGAQAYRRLPQQFTTAEKVNAILEALHSQCVERDGRCKCIEVKCGTCLDGGKCEDRDTATHGHWGWGCVKWR